MAESAAAALDRLRNPDAILGQALAVPGGLAILGIVFYLAIHSRG